MSYVPVIIGSVAAALALATVLMRAPIRLRQLAIASFALFIIYAVWTRAWPIAVYFAILLAINVWRLRELRILTQKVQGAMTGDLSMEWLRPFMTPRKFVAGEYIFRKGDPQTDVLYIVNGTVRLPEIEVTVNQGELLGEMAIFSPTMERSLSAVCVTDVESLHMSTDGVLKLYYQNPEFGLYLVRLITRRLLQDTHLLGSMINERTTQLEKLKALTDVDEATGVANRRAFEARLHMEWSRAIRSPAALSIVVAQIEDRYNRRWTDEMLTQVAIALGSCASRASDLLARHEKEFVAILPNTSIDGARRIADEMDATIAGLDVPSASIWAGDLRVRHGTATRTPTKEIAPETLLEEAYRELHGNGAKSDAAKGTDILGKLAQAAFPSEEPLIGG
ncbi:MAG: diguanylate cyclase [Candidatus Eremiobacteraeota bacterium]|nr:diguanylate cyclase [Candidatus Eremiobacteraeota bacterium]